MAMAGRRPFATGLGGRPVLTPMERRLLGDHFTVSEVALGCMAMSGTDNQPDDRESIATIHAALDAGVTLLDTGDFYGMGSNELLIRDALRGRRREDVAISVKFGGLRGPDRSWGGYDARPVAVKNFLAYTLTRLGTDYVDVYRPARVDPAVPIEETVGAIGDMIDAGHVRHVGLSEVSPQTLRRACAIRPISDVQIEYSLFTRGPAEALFPTADELGVGITAYGILAKGLLAGTWSLERKARTVLRRNNPRLSDENLPRNLALAEALRPLADELGVTLAQLATAWVLARAPFIVPLIGARTRGQLSESLAALELRLSDADRARIEAAVPAELVAGTRYDRYQMEHLDSERVNVL